MRINSIKELKDINLIILSDGDIDSKLINKFIRGHNYYLHIFFIDAYPNNLNFLKRKMHSNVTYSIFDWSLFNNEFTERWYSHKESIKNVNNLYKMLVKNNKLLIHFFTKLYSNKNIHLAFEKRVSLYLNKYFQMIKIYDLMQKHNTNIIPILNKEKYFQFTQLTKENTFNSKILFFSRKYLDKEFYKSILIFILYPFFCLLNIRKIVLNKIKKKIAIRIYKKSFGFAENKFKIDWILNKEYFNSDNSIFVFEDYANHKHLSDLLTKKYDYHLCSNRKPLERCSLNFLIKIIFIYIPLSFLAFPIMLFSNKILIEEGLVAWTKFFIWKNFTSIFNVKSYLSYHHYSSDHIYRNIILKKNKCISAMYKHTHSENVFDYKNKENYANVNNMNSLYDIEFHWSKCSIEMAKSNKTKSEKLVVSGPLWSSKEFLQNSRNNEPDVEKGHTIAFFPASFNSTGVTNNVEAHNKFLLLAKDILEVYQNFKIIFKPKFKFDSYLEKKLTKETAEHLLKNGNFKIIQSDKMPSSIFPHADVIISMSFTSTGIEAIRAGKKSFYVDLLNNYQNSYFDNFDNLVSHSRESALKNLKFWQDIDSNELIKKYEIILNEMQINKNAEPADIIRSEINKINSHN